MQRLPSSVQSDRLILRPLLEKDIPEFLDIIQASNTEFSKWYSGAWTDKELTFEKAKIYIADCLVDIEKRNFIQLGVFDRQTEKLIGAGSLHHLDWTVPKGRIGYIVDTRETGKGYATEIANIMTRYAFDILKFLRLEIRAETRNIPSNIIPRKLGYEFLTVFEKNKRGKDGTLWNLEIHVRFDTDNMPPLNLVYND